MFALYTPTRRMKGSGVVQSLKSLASKLHPQLPLSPKESQRLLTALTGSFRHQLDQAHPRSNAGEDAKATQRDADHPKLERVGVRSLHASSVESADKHLASVLTSPLLTRPYGSRAFILDYESAQKSLLEDPYQDPASLLEGYHENGTATIPIAALCLEKYQERLNGTPKGAREKLVLDTQAAKRTLRWLWDSNLHDTDGFVDDGRLMGVLIPLLMEEGEEELLWEWLKTDMKLGSQTRKLDTQTRQSYYEYRWKGRILFNMVLYKLRLGKQTKSADDALDTYFRAVSLPNSFFVPLAAPAVRLTNEFSTQLNPFANTDIAKFERFRTMGPSYLSRPILQRRHDAILALYHPHTPTALPFLKLLRNVFGPKPVESAYIVARDIQGHKTTDQMYSWLRKLLRVVAMLDIQGFRSDSKWVKSLVYRDFSASHELIEPFLAEERSCINVVAKESSSSDDEGPMQVSNPVSFATFT